MTAGYHALRSGTGCITHPSPSRTSANAAEQFQPKASLRSSRSLRNYYLATAPAFGLIYARSFTSNQSLDSRHRHIHRAISTLSKLSTSWLRLDFPHLRFHPACVVDCSVVRFLISGHLSSTSSDDDDDDDDDDDPCRTPREVCRDHRTLPALLFRPSIVLQNPSPTWTHPAMGVRSSLHLRHPQRPLPISSLHVLRPCHPVVSLLPRQSPPA